jgi:DNA-binding beta-propeller fold protein YncE
VPFADAGTSSPDADAETIGDADLLQLRDVSRGAISYTDSGDMLQYTPTPFTVTMTKSVGVPKANPVGIATDQKHFWLLFGASNSWTHQLIYYDVGSNKTLKSFTLKNLIENLGTGVSGIAWDGAAVWIAVAGNTNKIVRVDPETGQILSTFSSPSSLGPTDLAFDGAALWMSSGSGAAFKIDPKTGGSGQFLTHVNADTGYEERDRGIATTGNELWIGSMFNKQVLVYDKVTGKPKAAGNLVECGMMCFFGKKLVVLSKAGIKFYDLSRP